MSVTADLARWTWRAAGPTSDFIAAMAPYFAEIGAAQPELDLLTHAGITLQPDQLGCWLEQRGDAINAGWYLPLDLRLADVRFVLPSHPATDAVFAWAAEFGVDTTERVGRAAGAGSPYAELLLPLRAGDDVADQVHAALQLFESLEAAPPPDAALGLIMNLEHQGLALTVWLSDDGPVKVGLLAARPRTALMLELCDLTGATDHEPLASLQGILGVDAPSYVECQTRAAGFGVELHYQVDLEERIARPEP